MTFNPGLKIGQILKNADIVDIFKWKYGGNETFKDNEYSGYCF